LGLQSFDPFLNTGCFVELFRGQRRQRTFRHAVSLTDASVGVKPVVCLERVETTISSSGTWPEPPETAALPKHGVFERLEPGGLSGAWARMWS
jgi:hypothetical protein